MDTLTAADPGRVGPYQIAGRLGTSELAIVYLARSARGSTVVVKVVRPAYANDENLRLRLLDSIKDRPPDDTGTLISRLLKHDVTAWPPWVATAHEPGMTLEKAVTRFGPLPEQAVALLADGLLRPLRWLHGRATEHGALKASNVLLTEDGPRLLDVGTALSTGAPDDPTALRRLLEYAAGGADRLPAGLAPILESAKPPRIARWPYTPVESFDGWLPQEITIAALRAARAALTAEARILWRSPDERSAVRPFVRTEITTRPAPPETDPEPPRMMKVKRRHILTSAGGLLAVAGAAAVGIRYATREPGPDQPHWRYDTGEPLDGAFLVEPIARVVLAATSFEPRLIALDLATGAKRWDRAASAVSEYFTTARGAVLVCLDGRLHALDPKTGSSVWATGDFGLGTGDFEWANVTADADRAYVVGGGTVTAIDLSTREIVWQVENEASVSRTATVYRGTLLLGLTPEAACLDARTGKKLWGYDLGQYLGAAPVGDGDLAWIGNRIGDLVALDIGTGTVRYKLLTSGGGNGDAGSQVAVAKGIAVVGTVDFEVYGVETATGAIRWKYRTGPADGSSGINSSPVIDGDTVYIGSGVDDFLALDLASGQPRWRFRTGNTVNSSPAVHGDLVYFGSFDGNIYAVRKTTGQS